MSIFSCLMRRTQGREDNVLFGLHLYAAHIGKWSDWGESINMRRFRIYVINDATTCFRNTRWFVYQRCMPPTL